MEERNSILIVDDDESLLDILKTALSSEGYRCETATNLESAIELIDKISFDIMITDIRMPRIEGFELTEKAKIIRPDIAVIIMTAFIDEFSYDRAIEVGASDFIKKPFTLKELIARIQHVKVQKRIRSMLVTDELTGLYNRRGFFTFAEQELKLANRLRRELYLLYADLDNLKEINDSFGHLEGDFVLIETAKILKDTFRQSDIIARIGGDEFVAILTGTTETGTNMASSRLQKNIDVYCEERNPLYKMSMSVGIAKYNPEFPCSVDELIGQADKSMYEQKRYKQLF